jgi:hypothetical protein
MSINKLSWMLLASLSIGVAKEKLKEASPFEPSLNFRVQPMVELNGENKEFANIEDSASLKSGINSANISVKLSPLKGDYVGAVLSFDFAKSKVLRNAYVDFKWHKLAKLKVGRYKMPFGLDFQKGGSDFYRIYSSKSSDYIKDFVSESRQLGIGIRGKVKLPLNQKISYDCNHFESNNVFISGVNPVELVVGSMNYQINDFKVGGSWLSELIERSRDASYRANLWSIYSSFKPKYGLFEIEAVIGNSEISKYNPSLEDTLDFSLREMKMIYWDLANTVKLNNSVEYEFLKYSTKKSHLFTLGLGLNTTRKESPWGLSLNWRTEINEDGNGQTKYLWDEMGLLLNYSINWE